MIELYGFKNFYCIEDATTLLLQGQSKHKKVRPISGPKFKDVCCEIFGSYFFAAFFLGSFLFSIRATIFLR